MHENETLSVIIYFFNKFNEAEAYHIWGGGPYSLGEHMIKKYQNFVSTYGNYAARRCSYATLIQRTIKK